MEDGRLIVDSPTRTKLRWNISLFCVSTLLLWISLYAFVPILPVHAGSLPGGTMATVGLMLSSYSVAMILLRIPIGVWSDKLGTSKPFILVGLTAAGVGAFFMAISPNIWVLTFGRLITGVAAAAWVEFTVFFTSYFAPERTPRAMGVLSFLMGLGQVVATYLGGYLAEQYGPQAVFYVAAALAFLGVAPILKLEEAASPVTSQFSWASLRKVAAVPLLWQVSIATGLIILVVFSVSLGFLPIYADRLGASKSELGLLNALFFASYTLACLSTALLTSRWGLRLAVVIGALCTAGGSLVIPWIGGVSYLIPVEILGGAGWGLTFPILMGLSIKEVANSQRSTAMGIFQAVYGFGLLIGPPLAGVWAEVWGLESVFIICSGAGLMALALALTVPPRCFGPSS